AVLAGAGGVAGFELLVGVYYALDELVAHHVALLEVDGGDAFHTREDLDRLEEAATAAEGEIHLGEVASDDRLGVEAHAGEEHLHLFLGGVLGLVEDDEGIVEGAAAH